MQKVQSVDETLPEEIDDVGNLIDITDNVSENNNDDQQQEKTKKETPEKASNKKSTKKSETRSKRYLNWSK